MKQYFSYFCIFEGMATHNNIIRFGLMLDSLVVQKWQAETVRLLIDNGVNLSLVILNQESGAKVVSFLEKIKSYPYRKIIFRLWNRYFFKPECKAATKLNLPEETPVMKCKPILKGISSYFSEKDIAAIKAYDLDFVLRFGFDIVRGGVLQCARFGIWSYHHDDERVVRGGPPGFWEFMRGIPENGVILQQLTDNLDKGLILKRMKFSTCQHSYKEHLNNLFFESKVLPLQVCKAYLSGEEIQPQLSDSKAQIIHPPTNIQMIKYFWLCFWRRLKFHAHFLCRQEDWNVGYCRMPITQFLHQKDKERLDIHWFKPKKSEYFADPFVLSTKKDTYIFFEWFSNKKGKSDLAVAKMSEHFEKYYVISDVETHQSYPFVFEHENVIYCIPESYNTGKVSLYRFDENSLRLKFDSDLLENVSYTDPTLYVKDGKYFLFLTPQKASHTQLYLYVADDFRGPYMPHRGNPVKVDCADARPAGKILNIDGMEIRPAQNSTEHYGQSITLNKITKLTENQFKEEIISEISPLKNTTYNKGIHTVNGNEKISVFDAKRFVFTRSGFMHQLKVKLKR